MRAYVRQDATTQTVEQAEVTAPSPGDGEVAIDVAAFGVGIHDRYFIPADGPFPYVIGTEASGVVTAVGAEVRDIVVGDRVMGSSSLQPQGRHLGRGRRHQPGEHHADASGDGLHDRGRDPDRRENRAGVHAHPWRPVR